MRAARTSTCTTTKGVVYRIKPRYNAEVNTWWISDDTRYSYKAVHDEKRLRGAMRTQYGSQVATNYQSAVEEADAGLRNVVKENGAGSLYAMLSPMMACEEAFLLGTYIRSIDPQAVLVLGPVPTAGEDEVFKQLAPARDVPHQGGESAQRRRHPARDRNARRPQRRLRRPGQLQRPWN